MATAASLRRAINKAVRYIEEGRVVEMGPGVFYIIGGVRRHIVRVKGDRLVCTCDGFRETGCCSHVLAVSAVLYMKDGQKFLDERVRARMLSELKRYRGFRNP